MAGFFEYRYTFLRSVYGFSGDSWEVATDGLNLIGQKGLE